MKRSLCMPTATPQMQQLQALHNSWDRSKEVHKEKVEAALGGMVECLHEFQAGPSNHSLLLAGWWVGPYQIALSLITYHVGVVPPHSIPCRIHNSMTRMSR